ncbi:MAG TPA: hypothetical protein VLG28_14225 [Acidimicrobiia bacterium]|jgi:hypothetical protein|nr:hypothetical protein [Acidimicrobiia bacterium]
MQDALRRISGSGVKGGLAETQERGQPRLVPNGLRRAANRYAPCHPEATTSGGRALVAGYAAVGIAGSTALAAVLLFRLVTFWLPILPG